MLEIHNAPFEPRRIAALLDAHKDRMKPFLRHCMHCTMCADSCFLFNANDRDPQYMPSFKVINSVGVMYKKGARIERADLEKMKRVVWKNCVLCTRCYCPVGVDIPGMIAFARSVLRSQGVFPDFDEKGQMESWL